MQSQSTVNKVILVGRILEEPSALDNEACDALHFTLLTTEEVKTKGQTTVHQERHIVRVNTQLINCGQLKKDQTVYLQGKIQTKHFVDEGGIKRFKTEIVATSIELLT